jgi:hypothetical protein
MKITFIIVSLLVIAATANATELKCKIDPSIMPETLIDIPNSPGIMRAGQLGGVMSELTILQGNQLEITVLEANKEIAKTTGSASVTQTAKAITANGSVVEVTCSPKN